MSQFEYAALPTYPECEAECSGFSSYPAPLRPLCALPYPFPSLPFNVTAPSGGFSVFAHQLPIRPASLVCACRQLFLANAPMAACFDCRNATATAALRTLCAQNPGGVLPEAAAAFFADAVQFLVGPPEPPDTIYGRYYNQSASYYLAKNPEFGGSGSSSDLNEVTARRVGIIIGFILAGIVACALLIWLGRFLLFRYFLGEPTTGTRGRRAFRTPSSASAPDPPSRSSTFLYTSMADVYPAEGETDAASVASLATRTTTWDKITAWFRPARASNPDNPSIPPAEPPRMERPTVVVEYPARGSSSWIPLGAFRQRNPSVSSRSADSVVVLASPTATSRTGGERGMSRGG
ncbi:hypothetical protein DFJ74DRAFT_706713 [Hyaloraphidium curvatum]|nr:hypothetical protein DFJ74DRAFT_706713 [Hyaloraphidium curvatum]